MNDLCGINPISYYVVERLYKIIIKNRRNGSRKFIHPICQLVSKYFSLLEESWYSEERNICIYFPWFYNKNVYTGYTQCVHMVGEALRFRGRVFLKLP